MRLKERDRAVTLEPSVVPAIDALVGRYTSRDFVAASEVVDILLDLRLLAEADELVRRET